MSFWCTAARHNDPKLLTLSTPIRPPLCRGFIKPDLRETSSGLPIEGWGSIKNIEETGVVGMG